MLKHLFCASFNKQLVTTFYFLWNRSLADTSMEPGNIRLYHHAQDAGTGRVCRLHTGGPRPGSSLRPGVCCAVAVLATAPPCRPLCYNVPFQVAEEGPFIGKLHPLLAKNLLTAVFKLCDYSCHIINLGQEMMRDTNK